MFNKDFYPTPTNIIEKMLEPYVWVSRDGTHKSFKPKRVLDPSAGKGDILDYIVDNYGGYWGRRELKKDCFAIELESDLVSILNGKKYKVIGTDFLQFSTHLTFDLICMNPPFSTGAKHLLHAWDISKGGDIVCLLNSNTYTNPFSQERVLLKSIIDKYGEVEFLGKCFSSTTTAERTTNVDVILVRLEKPKTFTEEEFIFSDLNTESFVLNDFDNINELADRNVLRTYELSYKASITAYKELLQAQDKLNHYRKDICYLDTKTETKTDYAKQFQEYIEKSNVEAWTVFLRKTKFERYLTNRVRTEFEERFNTQKLIAFTEDNMRNILETLFLSQDSLLTDCIVDGFDLMTQYHKYNRILGEGWKTNKAWYVNSKVILPNIVNIDYGRFRINWDKTDVLKDIDRSMCYVSGLQFENITTIVSALEDKFKEVEKNGYSISTNMVKSTFFKLRFYKKGTLHLYFLNEYFWHEFNRIAASKKGFPLPERMSFDVEYPAFTNK